MLRKTWSAEALCYGRFFYSAMCEGLKTWVNCITLRASLGEATHSLIFAKWFDFVWHQSGNPKSCEYVTWWWLCGTVGQLTIIFVSRQMRAKLLKENGSTPTSDSSGGHNRWVRLSSKYLWGKLKDFEQTFLSFVFSNEWQYFNMPSLEKMRVVEAEIKGVTWSPTA